jgi:signal transduction histidine kinase/CheY-like chemotaxis protein
VKPDDNRLLVVAPTGRDAQMVCDTLRGFALPCESSATVQEACEKAGHGVGALLLAEECLTAGALSDLARLIQAQPQWSGVPVILLTSNGDRIHAAGLALLEQAGVRGNLVIVERPARLLTLRTAVETALHNRKRQYQLRDYLEELARQEERLRQSQKMESIGILAGGIAHDFNNILTGVLGNASLALTSLSAGSPNHLRLQEILEGTESAAHLTRQLLAYAGKGQFVLEPVDLSEQVRAISGLIRMSIPKRVDLRLVLTDGLPCIEGDSSQIQQIIMNLIINGAEAIPEGRVGTVIVTTGVQDVDEEYLRAAMFVTPVNTGTYVALEVQDSGVGMDEPTQARVFDPFFTTKFAGRGLGLAAVMGIVKGHNGALKIYSTPGRGSTFRVLLPGTGQSRPIAVTAKTDPRVLRGTGTVLVIDDEAMVRRVAKAALERFGYSVILCEGGPEGVALFGSQASEITVILLDMSMPTMGGEETFRHLRSIRPDVKVILSSGYNEVEATSRFTGIGLAGFIQKPYTCTRLAQVIRSVLQA